MPRHGRGHQAEFWTHPSRGAEAWQGFGRRMFIGMLFFLGFIVLVIVGIVTLVAAIISRTGVLPFVVGILALPVVLAILGAIAGRVFSRTWRPVQRLIAAAGSLADGDYSARVSETGPPTIRSVAVSFNEMATRLETAEEQRRRLLADLGHELRTPLTIIRGEVEAIRDGVHPPDDDTLAAVLGEVGVMERLLEDLRTLSLLDAGVLSLDFEPTDLGALVSDITEGYGRRLALQEVELRVDAADDLELLVDPVRIREVVGNLIVNAGKAMPDGGRLAVSVSREGGHAVIEVADTGIGIGIDELARVFDRFHKGSTSTGSGLGLTISRDLVEAHGGSISLESTAEVGTTVRVELPLLE